MALFRKRGTDDSLPKTDRGFGSLDDYRYDLLPKNKRVTIVLAGSDPHQNELREIVASGSTEAETAISPRTVQQEGQDAPIEVRLFTGRRVSKTVGVVPRGLETVVDEALRRLDDKGENARLPARIVERNGTYRVELLMGRLTL